MTTKRQDVGRFQIIDFPKAGIIITGRRVDDTYSIGWANDKGNRSRHFTSDELIVWLELVIGPIKEADSND
ncbi:unnamed protein product [marine sediment metagenome]|uniref:Uncharacterized protein n=1 Tax=marine sediment metagenome TaxID=412755 RepID=X1N7F5_9ZZZZ